MSKPNFKDFAKFTGRRRVFGEDPNVVLLKQGRIGINKAADQTYFKDYDFVELFFNEEADQIALKPSKERVEGSYELKRTTTTYISAIAFFRYCGLSVDEGTDCEIIHFDEGENVLFLQIKRQEKSK